jgi:hypothetical protein
MKSTWDVYRPGVMVWEIPFIDLYSAWPNNVPAEKKFSVLLGCQSHPEENRFLTSHL